MLSTDDLEVFVLNQAGSVEVPKLCTSFKRWDAPLDTDDYGGKTFLNWRGEPVFGELAIA